MTAFLRFSMLAFLDARSVGVLARATRYALTTRLHIEHERVSPSAGAPHVRHGTSPASRVAWRAEAR